MFIPYKTDDGRVPAWEYLPASAITPKVGLALVLTSGQLAKASGTTKPTYICMTEKDAAVTAGEIIPVVRVNADMILVVNHGQFVELGTHEELMKMKAALQTRMEEMYPVKCQLPGVAAQHEIVDSGFLI